MIVMIIECNVKPEKRDEFLKVIEHDAVHSERDEPGCLRFDVLNDLEDPNKFFFYEVYEDEAARLAHRETPHCKEFFAALPNLANGDLIRHMARNVVPGDAGFVR